MRLTLFFQQLGFPRRRLSHICVSLEMIQRLEEYNPDLTCQVQRLDEMRGRVEVNEETYGILPQFVEDIDRTISDDFLRVQQP